MDQNRDAIAGMVLSAAACLFLAAAIEEKKKENSQRNQGNKNYRKSRKLEGQQLIRELSPISPDSFDIDEGQQLIKECYNSFDFKNVLRMDEDSFNFILEAVRNDITKQDTNMRKAVTAEDKLAITLRFLATGETFRELACNSKVSKPFLTGGILDVCNAIFDNLKDQFLKFPATERDWANIANDFSSMWQFPHCLGALDGKHIAFRPSKKNSPLYYNNKGFHSIVLLGLADAFAKFIFVDVGCNGRIRDCHVLQRSNFQYILQQPDKYLPPQEFIGNARKVPHIFVADNAFPLTQNIMTPYPSTTINERQQTFNRRLNLAWQNIERAFEIMSSRFRIFQTTINLKEEKVKKIVLCCCVLHNVLISRSEWYREGEINIGEQIITSQQVESQHSNPTSFETGEAVRKELTEYFNNEGRI